MYRDNSLMPKEAVRLATLGTLALRPTRYADLAAAVRHFTARLVGPSLDLLGTSLELLRYEGLVEAVEGTGMEDNALLAVTEAGLAEFGTLMRANVRAPSSDDLNKLVVTLKLRFLHLLPAEERREQAGLLAELHETELARVEDLRRHHEGEPGHLSEWLDHDTAQLRARIDWFRALERRA
jgi:DNA-binding PadR family transcriptional regulator